MNITTGKLSITGGDIFYKKVSADRTKYMTPLLIVHGGPGASHHYLNSLDELANDHPVILYDQLGCGNSDHPQDKTLWTISRFVEEISKIREHLNLNEIHLFGHSWGGSLAIEYALQNPHGLKSIILASPLLSMRRWVEDSHTLVNQLATKDKETILHYEKLEEFSHPDYLATRMAYAKQFVCRLNPWPETLTYTLEHTNIEIYNDFWGTKGPRHPCGKYMTFERLDDLSKINISTLITCGKYDSARPATMQMAQKKMPHAELLVFQKSAHMPHLEETNEYLKCLKEFISKS